MRETGNILGRVMAIVVFCAINALGENVPPKVMPAAEKDDILRGATIETNEKTDFLSKESKENIDNKLRFLENDIRRIEVTTNLNERSISNHITVFPGLRDWL